MPSKANRCGELDTNLLGEMVQNVEQIIKYRKYNILTATRNILLMINLKMNRHIKENSKIEYKLSATLLVIRQILLSRNTNSVREDRRSTSSEAVIYI